MNDIWMPFITDHGIEHFFNLFQIAELLALRAAGGVTNGTTQIAVIANLDQRQAGMLLMIAAKATIIRAPPLDGSVVNQRHLWRFDEDFTAAAVIIHIVGDENSLVPVLRASLEHENLAILKDGLGFDLLIASGADRDHNVVEKIGPGFVRHEK